MYERATYQIKGVSPLLQHNGQLADPLNKWAKEMKKISGKRAKTEADFAELARLEFMGGLYLHNGEPCLPGELLEAAFVEGAKKLRKGQQAKAGIIVDGFASLAYDGPRKPDELWEDESFRLTAGVRVQRNRVMRTRPIFRDWSVQVDVDFMPDVLNKTDIDEIVAACGRVVGLGDWRPRFGRFDVAG